MVEIRVVVQKERLNGMCVWVYFSSLHRVRFQMLSSKTLVTLLGYDPMLHPESSLPVRQPQVTFAYAKHLWMSGKRVYAYQQLTRFLHEYTQQGNDDSTAPEDRQRLLAR